MKESGTRSSMESGTGEPNEHFAKLLENWLHTLGEDIYISFYYSHIRQNSMPPGINVFPSINMAWRNLVEDPKMNISTQLFEQEQSIRQHARLFAILIYSKQWLVPNYQ